jgi:hypothetical protein
MARSKKIKKLKWKGPPVKFVKKTQYNSTDKTKKYLVRRVQPPNKNPETLLHNLLSLFLRLINYL